MIANLVINSLVGDSVSPTIDNRKQIAPAVLAAIIGGGATLVSGAASLISQADVNKANRDIAAENREWQSEENRKAEQWSDQMWQKQFDLTNQYNTPSAMRQRLEEGGYNPFLFDGSSIGTAAGNASMGSVPSPSRQSAPNQPTQTPLDFDFIGQAGQNAVANYYNAQAVNAQSANQQAQSDYYQSVTAKNLYEVYGKEAAQEYGRRIGYTENNSPSMRLAELEIAGKQLQNQRVSLENQLIDKYGDKKASAEIANLEQLTTKYVADIGLMASQGEVNDSIVSLNSKRAEALGAQMARDFAQAGLFTSEASINNGIVQYAIEKFRAEAGSATLRAGMDAMNFESQGAEFRGNASIRSFIGSEAGQSRRLWNYKLSPEGNYINAFIGGFTKNLNGVVGVNANISRSWSTSGSVNTSHSFIHSNQY